MTTLMDLGSQEARDKATATDMEQSFQQLDTLLAEMADVGDQRGVWRSSVKDRRRRTFEARW